MSWNHVAFNTSAVGRGLALTVKNTFIDFELPSDLTDASSTVSAATSSRIRAPSCPTSFRFGGPVDWEGLALRELCKAFAFTPNQVLAPAPNSATEAGMEILFGEVMVPVGSHSTVAGAVDDSGSKEDSAAVTTPTTVADNRDADALSDLSTSASEGRLSPPSPGGLDAQAAIASEEPAETSSWKSVPARKKAQHVSPSCEVAKVADRGGQDASDVGRSCEEPWARSWNVKGRGKGVGKAKGKGAGLPYFRRVEVGIEDDKDFRVVQRLIGPRGKYIQDIAIESGGAKVWIIGSGSRSWEDDEGPLMVCVGATSSTSFDYAFGLVNELLEAVYWDHSKFQRDS